MYYLAKFRRQKYFLGFLFSLGLILSLHFPSHFPSQVMAQPKGAIFCRRVVVLVQQGLEITDNNQTKVECWHFPSGNLSKPAGSSRIQVVPYRQPRQGEIIMTPLPESGVETQGNKHPVGEWFRPSIPRGL